MQYKKKLTDIFLRKQSNKKQSVPINEPEKIKKYDQSYFESNLIYDQFHTTLIKVTATIKKGFPNQGQLIPLKCKWYIKNQFDFKQIQQINSQCYQPCLNDIGNIICVQIQPQIQGMIYTGITIMKQTQILKMDKKLEQMANQYFSSTKQIQMQGKIETMYSQDPKYQYLQFPLEIISVLCQNKVTFKSKSTKQIINSYEINQTFPQIQFNRKSYNSILFNCNQNQTMKLSLMNNFHRDLFALIIRLIPNRLVNEKKILNIESIDKLQINSERKNSLNQNQKSVNSEQYNRLIFKIDQLQKQIKNQKRLNQELATNYHLQRTSKINLQNLLSKLQIQYQKLSAEHAQCTPLHVKIKKISQENKFYFNQISIIKNELKQKNNLIKTLKKEKQELKSSKQIKQCQIIKITQQPKEKIKQLQNKLIKSLNDNEKLQRQIESLKQNIIQLENSNNVIKKKLNSIVSEKSLPSSPIKSSQNISTSQELSSNKQIKTLKMQIKNIQMLLKHRAGQKGGQMIGMQHLVNNLTESITEKQLEIDTLKKINKQLVKKCEKNQNQFMLQLQKV